MTLQLVSTKLSGVLLVEKKLHKDNRGVFSKTFNQDQFRQLGLNGDFEETFLSVSAKDVLRGMHYQVNPFSHEKIVSVISGTILDVVVCIDYKSDEYGHFIELEVSSETPYSIYIGKGYAHGFLTTSRNAIVLYQTSCGYNKESDTGIHHRSFNYTWPSNNLIVSDRDKALAPLGSHQW